MLQSGVIGQFLRGAELTPDHVAPETALVNMMLGGKLASTLSLRRAAFLRQLFPFDARFQPGKPSRPSLQQPSPSTPVNSPGGTNSTFGVGSFGSAGFGS